MERLIERCRSTNSPKLKQAALKECAEEYPILKDMLYRTYEPFIMYHMMSKLQLDDFGNMKAVDAWPEFCSILDTMSISQTPQKNKELLTNFLERCSPNTQTLFSGVVRKKLNLGFGIKLINKTFPGLITEFDVMLASRFDPDKTYAPKIWKASCKLDGLRLVSILDFPTKGWHIFTRKGKEITDRLPHLVPDLERFKAKYGFTFVDGEGYKHERGFEKIAGDILSHDNYNCSYIEYRTFAFGDKEAFFKKIKKGILIPSRDKIECGNIITVPHFDIPNDSRRMIAFAEKMEAGGFEGGMFRNPNMPYANGRTLHLLKLKTWLLDRNKTEVTVKCVRIEGSTQDRADGLTGAMTEVYTMKSIAFLDPKDGIITNTGSGFTHKQRDEIWEKRNEFEGKMFDVKFQRLGSKGRKIFPVFVRWRPDRD
jgi:ATP-dependent DNA ligase